MIIEIPKQAVVNRIVPKDRFNFDDATKLERIRWLEKKKNNKINLPAKKIQEIEIFSIEMFEFDVRVIKEIISTIPQEILFIINDEFAIMYYQGKCISKKVKNHLQIKGLSIDEVRDNFIRQLLHIEDIFTPLKQQMDEIQIINELEFEIDRINTQIKRSIQTNKKQALARERYTLEQNLAKLKGE